MIGRVVISATNLDSQIIDGDVVGHQYHPIPKFISSQ